MHRRPWILAPLALAALALAACSKGGVDVKNESGEKVAEKIASAGGIMLNPGQWQSSLKMESLDMGRELPPQVKQAMEKSMGMEKSFATCLTPEQAKAPKGDFFNQQAGCTYDHFTMSGGTIDSAATCTREGVTQTITMQGQYSPDSYQMRMQSSSQIPGGMTMSMAMTISARRTGPCTGKEQG